jgi:hypothetical protein
MAGASSGGADLAELSAWEARGSYRCALGYRVFTLTRGAP